MKPCLAVATSVLALCLTVSEGMARTIACVVEPRSTTILSSAVEGLVTDVYVGRGDHVAAGDLLIQLDDELERLQIELSKARADSDVNIRAQNARRELRSKEYERVKQLSERNVTADTVRDDAEIELALTDLALEEAIFNQRLAEIEMEQARAVFDRRQIKSPVDGIVLSVDINPGEFASEQKELLTIVEVDELYIEVFAPAEFFDHIEPGLDMPVRLKPPMDVAFTARVETVDEVFDAASGTFGVRLVVDNQDGGIPAGSRCEVEFGTPGN